MNPWLQRVFTDFDKINKILAPIIKKDKANSDHDNTATLTTKRQRPQPWQPAQPQLKSRKQISAVTLRPAL